MILEERTGNMNFRRLMVALFTFVVMCAAPSAESKGSHPPEQSAFSAEDDVVKNLFLCLGACWTS